MEEPLTALRKRKLADREETNNSPLKTQKSEIKDIKTKSIKKDTKIKLQDGSEKYDNVWSEAAMLSFMEKLPQQLSEKIITLLTEGCTLPFIARYRKEAVGYLLPDR